MLLSKISVTLKSIAIAVLLLLTICYYLFFLKMKQDNKSYIAHGGGAIDGYPITNSLEAVENAIAKGIKYIELDLQITSDNKLVATHDWETFKLQTGIDFLLENLPTYETFEKARIWDKYTPMTYRLIDSIFTIHKDLYLVTDKITDIRIIDKYLSGIKNRTLVECFSESQYQECIKSGYQAMRSFHNLYPTGINVVADNSLRYVYQHLIPTQFAMFSNERLSIKDADSIFNSDHRIRFIYVDYLN